MALYGFSLNTPSDGPLLAKQISSVSAGERSLLLSRGVTLTPYSCYSTGQTVRQSLLPFPQYSTGISPAQAPLGNTWYDALQLNVTQRFSHGLSFNYKEVAGGKNLQQNIELKPGDTVVVP